MRIKAALIVIACACLLIVLSGGASGADTSSQCQGIPRGGGGVEIRLPGPHPVTIGCSASVIEANYDVTNRTYTVCGPLGNVCNPVTIADAISVGELLTVAGVDPAKVSLAAVIPSAGPPSILKAFGASGDEPTGPIITISGSDTRYLGPAGNATSTGSYEEISVRNGIPVKVLVTTGTVIGNITLTSNSSATTVALGTRVQFTVSGAPAGSTYHWSFGDGTAITTIPTIARKYTGKGTFSVYVVVVGPDGGVGVPAAPLQFNVSAIPSKSQENPNTGGSSVNGSGNTSTTGTNTTPSTTTTATSTYVPPVKPPRPQIAPTAAASAGEPIVDGRLISDVTPEPVSRFATANVGNAAGGTQTGFAPLSAGTVKPIAAILGAAAVVLLLATGAGQELRSLRRSIASSRLA